MANIKLSTLGMEGVLHEGGQSDRGRVFSIRMTLRIIWYQEVDDERGSKLQRAIVLVGGATELDVYYTNDNVYNDVLKTKYIVRYQEAHKDKNTRMNAGVNNYLWRDNHNIKVWT